MNIRLRENILFSALTTLRIGGPIKYFVPVFSIEELIQLIKSAEKERLPYLVIGGGSNLLVADEGFNGFVIQNLIHSIEIRDGTVEIGAGADLQELVWFANKNGILGFEKLAGIPGSVGGAVYGNAGAYGQVISGNLVWVEVLDSQTLKHKKLQKDESKFGYRDSGFKKTREIILKVGFSITKGDAGELSLTSNEVVKTRMQKYPPGIACPGSFFKNVEADKLSKEVLSTIPTDKILYGKIPAGWLLEEVGAKGQRRGGVEIAPWHGNLFINKGKGKASDFLELAREYKQKVSDKFGIVLESEVQLIGFGKQII